MNNRSLHHWYRRIRPLSFWYFLIAGLMCLVIGGAAYRQNNVKMLHYRDAVFTADEQNGDVEAALRQLREYIYAHMNTDLTPKKDSIRPPIQLKFLYERLTAAEKKRVAKANDAIYATAQKECQRRYLAGHTDRIGCIKDYMNKFGAKEIGVDPSLYQFDFASPSWTFDFAGWMLSTAFALLFLAIVRFGLERIVHSRLN